jgi:hypothetical protein
MVGPNVSKVFAFLILYSFARLRDICSILFSVYYLIYAHEADEKVGAHDSSLRVQTLYSCDESYVNTVQRAQ